MYITNNNNNNNNNLGRSPQVGAWSHQKNFLMLKSFYLKKGGMARFLIFMYVHTYICVYVCMSRSKPQSKIWKKKKKFFSLKAIPVIGTFMYIY